MSELYFSAILVPDPPKEFETWPPRITLLSRFELDVDRAQAIGERVSTLIPPFEVELGKRAVSGLSKAPVWGLEPNLVLRTLHLSLLSHADAANAHFMKLRYIGDNFQPHIPANTIRARSLPRKVEVSNFSLVERHKKGHRRILDTFELVGSFGG